MREVYQNEEEANVVDDTLERWLLGALMYFRGSRCLCVYEGVTCLLRWLVVASSRR